MMMRVVCRGWWWCECELQASTRDPPSYAQDGRRAFAIRIASRSTGVMFACLGQRRMTRKAHQGRGAMNCLDLGGEAWQKSTGCWCATSSYTLHDHPDELMSTFVDLVESRRAVVCAWSAFCPSLPSFSSSSLPTLSPLLSHHTHTHNHPNTGEREERQWRPPSPSLPSVQA